MIAPDADTWALLVGGLLFAGALVLVDGVTALVYWLDHKDDKR